MSGNEENSMKEAGGCAAGFTGRFYNFNTDAEMKLAATLLTVGKYVEHEAGCLLGHIKAAVLADNGEGITLNLTDMDNGVEHHGTMGRADEVTFNFMCAVLDVDEHELTHEMLHAIDDSGIDYFIDRSSLEHHHHHHDDGEECDDPDCDCHKHHDHECSCGHHHHDGEECDDPECECHHHHHGLADLIDDKGHLIADHHHEHEHHHDHECCCGHHHEHDDDHECHCHEHEHEHECGCGHHHDDDHECSCGHHHDHDDDHECHCHDHEHEHEHKECCCHEHKEEPKKEKKGFFSFLKRKK